VVKPEAYVVGVDGGATKTVALIGTATRILGRGESGSSNYHNVGTVAAGEAIRAAIVSARERANLPRVRLRTAVVALAAVDTAKGFQIARRFVRWATMANETYVIHDSVAALYAAVRGKPGIIVNSGTGCFAAGINGDGDYVRVGGWGYLIDDKGSAFDIGMKAITIGFRMADGRTPRTRLITLLKRRLGVKRFEEILDNIYSNKISVEQIAELAPWIYRATARDRFCRQILREAGTSLAELACTAAGRLKMTHTTFPLAMTGGGFKSRRYFVERFRSRVRIKCPQVQFQQLKEEPARGAYLIASLLGNELGILSRQDRWLRRVLN